LLGWPSGIRAFNRWPSRHGPHSVHQDEMAIVGLEGVSSIELGWGLPSSQCQNVTLCNGKPERGTSTYLGRLDALRPVCAAVFYNLAIDLWSSHRAASDWEDYARDCCALNVWDRRCAWVHVCYDPVYELQMRLAHRRLSQ
jgi:hypothetical protein